MTYRDRARGCLLGLAAGDALGAPAENLTPSEIRRRWGRLTEIERGGTDDTEYAIFAASLLVRHGHGLTSAAVADAYRAEVLPRIAGPMRGAGFSELGTVEALRRGLEPPMTGLVHQHGWSDGLAMRAAPYGIFCPGDPAEAARLVEEDGRVSQSGEGILGGRAVAGAVAAAMAGLPPREGVAAALSVVPPDSWTARAIERAVAALDRVTDRETDRETDRDTSAGSADESDSDSDRREAALVEALHEAVVVRHYPWTDVAPEAVALALAAYLAGGGEVEASVTFAVGLGRDADTIGAIAGAIAGAGQGEAGVPQRWAARVGPVAGTCLPVVAGRHVLTVADELADELTGDLAARPAARPAGEPADHPDRTAKGL
ncbi:ADP-ribosylglycohydrolase family protein [Nonomuraea sp. 3-1Str]|uniref:ADP-ribosylglycohydrolase family protein n=1 Tax=Nonomuraea sp. 3-1Str TaxID=2929801 RepID=UPI0028671F76|nr:ADP-ribosylglycohydrolase family protein [Nonomuraea sp. 3-1Str]MDR8411019.1 ADP-ribosylglycohydrolase family protein [Nonomuraea sp. 3-1Str]